jgi:hypothetical protein
MLDDNLKEALRLKIARLNAQQCEQAIKDCHETLTIGAYAYSAPYAQKLWFEIDTARERLMQLTKW